MKMKSLLGIMLSLCILQSCQNDETSIIRNEVNNKGIAFSSVIDDAQNSRAYNSTWEVKDEIGVFMLSHDNRQVLESNVTYVTNTPEGYFVSKNRPMNYPEDGRTVDFIAYYPYNESVTDYTSYTINLRDQSKQNAIDLMTATNLTGRDQNSPQGNLQFRHLLSKLVLNLSASEGNLLKGIKAKVKGVKVNGTADLSTGVLTPADETADLSLFVNEEGTQAEAVLLPQTLTGKLRISLELNGQQKEVDTQISGSLEPGTRYICNVKINYKGGEITPEPEGKYTKWTETPVITESQLNQSNLKYIIHYTGKRYTSSTLNGIDIRNYSMLYDTNLKMAYWVAYPLCAWYLDGDRGRSDAWGYDPELPNNLQPNLKNGIASYSRGHQIPSGDRQREDCQMNNQTFYYTNMTPQLQNGLNGTIWASLEGAVRGWSSGVDTLYVVTGAMPTTADDQQIKYAKDNNGQNIAIPKYYFKALARKVNGNYQAIAFKLDHKAYSDNNYMKYAVSVSQLEEMTGFTFFPSVPAEIKKNLNTSQWR